MGIIKQIRELNKKINDWLDERRRRQNQILDEQIIIETKKAELRIKKEQLRKLQQKGRRKQEPFFKGITFDNPIEAIKNDDKRRIL